MRALLTLGLLAICFSISGSEAARTMPAAASTGAPSIRTNKEGADFRPPVTGKEWQRRREELRKRVLVSTGLYPMPEKTPLRPRVYGRMERDGYTVEKVVLETLPGFYLSGNLYRPSEIRGKVPGILNPHGHWKEGRVAADVQARCIGQARMGAVAFLYDMVGYVDSQSFGHAFMNNELAMLGMNLPGLQLWNSIRALDWLMTLPEVDAKRIACTGESGGGTQTFLLCAVDDRVQVAAPVCMVSHHFQGGCSCENAPHLRVGTDNVEIAAMFAPKPMLLVGATGDWTSEILQRGVPEIRQVYKLHGREEHLHAVIHEADHNYNRDSRESVYTFFRRYLWDDTSDQPVKEAEFRAEDEATISTWDAAHPRPADAVTPEQLQQYLRGVVEKQVAALRPSSPGEWKRSAPTVLTGLQALLACEHPRKGELTASTGSPRSAAGGIGAVVTPLTITDTRSGRGVEAVLVRPSRRAADVLTVVVHPNGSEALLSSSGEPRSELARRLLEQRQSLLIVEPFLRGNDAEIARRHGAQYFSVYNRVTLAERVQEIVQTVAYAHQTARTVNLVGMEEAGPWVLLARAFTRKVAKVAAHGAWEWSPTTPEAHSMYLPGALRYGGMRAFAALAAPGALFVHGYGDELDVSWLQRTYGPKTSRLQLSRTVADDGALARWLTARQAAE